MLWSKIWFFFVAVAAALMTALVLCQPRTMQGELDAQVEARLGAADRGAAMLLKIHARRWLDETSHISSDAQLVEALDQSTRVSDKGSSSLELVHKSAQARLRSFNGDLKTDEIIAVDGKGRVLARTGLDEAVWRDDISGYPVVAEALRGYRLDDTWDMNGKLYRVSASPVIARDRYVGCLLVAQEIGADLAGRIHDSQGVEVAFLLNGQVVASSTSLPILSDLPSLLKAHAAELAEKGHTETLPVKTGDRSYVVTATTLPGEAAAHDAAYLLIAERPMATGITTTLAALSPSTMTSRDLALVVGGLFGALLIGLLLMALEHDRPTRRLLKATQALSRSEVPRLDDGRHPGRFGGVARAVNATLDRRASAPMRERERSLDHAGGGGGEGRLQDSAVRTHPERAIPIAAERAIPPVPAPMLIPVIDSGGLFPPTGPLPTDELRTVSTPMPVAVPQLASLDGLRSDTPMPPISPMLASVDQLRTDSFSEPSTNPHTRGLQLPLATDKFDAPPTVSDQHSSLGGDAPDESTTISNPTPSLLAALKDGGPETLDAEFKAVYREFLETKRRCGEPIDGVPFDKFVVKLQQNRDQLMSRYACKGVRFQVYVKDGKAALKATPVSR